MSIKAKSLSGIRWTSMSSICGLIIQLAQIAVLARYLPAEAFGLMGLALVAINFAHAFCDIGLSQAIIHYSNITRKQLSTLYWLNITASVFIAGCFIVLSPFIASFYNEVKLEGVLVFISLCFIFQAVGQQFRVILQKELYFKSIALIEIISKFIGLICAVGFAVSGFGVYSLVFAAIVTSFTASLGYVVNGFKVHKPLFYMDIKSVKNILHFGVYTSAERVVNLLGYNLDTLLIGKFLGVEALGLYSLAKQIIMRPAQVINPIVTRVTIPVMAKIQNDLEQLKKIYLRTTNYLASVNFPLYGFIAVFAPFIVDIMFGKQWGEIIPIIQILCVYGALRSIGNPVGSLIIARGRYKLGFWWNMLSLTVIVPTVYVGANYGLMGVCWGLVILGGVMSIPNWWFLVYRLSGAKFGEYHRLLLIPFFISFSGCAVAYGLKQILNDAIFGMIVGGMLGGLVILILNMILNRNFILTMVSMSGLSKR